MKTCLYTVNIGNVLGDNSRASFTAAAQRWGCDYIEIIQPYGKHHPCCAKADATVKLKFYDYLMYVDADTLISDKAPNPFELCNPDVFYVVMDAQDQSVGPYWMDAVYRKPLDVCQKQTGWEWAWATADFFNTGVMLFPSSYAIREMFEAVLRHLPENSTPHEEQAMINLCAWMRGLPNFLPTKWNYIVPPSGPNPDAFINHFAGDAKPLLKNATWRSA